MLKALVVLESEGERQCRCRQQGMVLARRACRRVGGVVVDGFLVIRQSNVITIGGGQ
jgi:hypothetical protein